MCNSSASDCWNATSAIQDRPGVVTKRIWPTNVNAWWLLEARIYSDNLLQTLEGKDYEMTLPCTNPQASSNHGPVIWTLVFKRGPKANLQLSYVGSLLQSGMQLYVLCHQGSFSMRGFFLCCSLCMVQGLPAKLNPPRQFAQTEVHSRNRGGKGALLGAENAAVVVLSLCLSPWLKKLPDFKRFTTLVMLVWASPSFSVLRDDFRLEQTVSTVVSLECKGKEQQQVAQNTCTMIKSW